MSVDERHARFVQTYVVAVVAMVALAALLTSRIVAMPLLAQSDAATRLKETALKNALFQMREAIDQYYLDNQRYPKSLKVLAAEGYLPKVPKDPFTNRSDSWRVIQARGGSGFYDVKSTSKLRALDGTKYSDW